MLTPIPGIVLATGHFMDSGTPPGTVVPPGYHTARTGLGDWLTARVTSRHEPLHTFAVHGVGVSVLIEGKLTHIEGQTSPLTSAAHAVLTLYLESGLECLTKLRGSYTGLILDPRTNQAHLFNDRRASRPMFYRESTGTSMLTGPEVALLAGAAPALQEIDPVAVCEFLIFASYYNDRTLFPAIRKLPPASVMSLGPGAMSLRRYWHIRIEPDKKPGNEDEWVKEALSLFNQSTNRLLAQAPRPFLYLSGGVDSRMILGGLRENGYVIPAVTYGTEAGDDAPIARQLAEHCGMPFTYFPMSTDDPQMHFLDAALRSDCRAETVDTPALGVLQDQLAASFGLFIQGDKSFFGHHVAASDEAFLQAGLLSFDQAVRLGDMLDPAVFRDSRRSIEHTLRDLHPAGPAINPADLRDQVYYEARLANRQNAFTAANLRLFEQARPWLDEDLVDFLFSMPGALRTGNRLGRKMLEMGHPDLAAIPFAQKDSIPQAHTYRQSIPSNPALGEFIRAQFHERLDPRLAVLFRPGSLALLIDSLLTGKAYPVAHIHWWQALPGMWRIDARRYHGDRVHPISIMLRLMQINLYLNAMAKDRTHH